MVQLLKVHGSENQFFILDQTQLDTQLTDTELSQLGIQLCNPENGILDGADGVLVVNTSTNSEALAQMRVINADGSEAKMCGNGLRTVSRYLSEKYNEPSFKIETLEANLDVKKSADLAIGVPAFSVQIKPISFEAKDLPFSYKGMNEMINEEVPEFIMGQTFTSIAVPNPHLISFVGHINEKELGILGKTLNSPNEYFPEGVNVSFAEIRGDNELFVQTYERGVGFTNACGTGMSATSLAFALLHKDKFTESDDISVYNPGGMVKTHITLGNTKEQSDIHLIGNATFTHTLDIDEADLHSLNLNKFDIKSTGEESLYQDFVSEIVK
ncbi:diaminopimelate epimerase [Companilactobacillus ginsenosidimutans]|uniref:Diaminopimelate epimerase n=1 Tax=Companilactobacillus ginsenosidimutans TaxID=1007676 RepID=A0A0H4QJI9_9LACO|nr:diaminopimelate epimerase [Companilactobacillus ginsenosidimutans]AKP66843.1 diaminopimelate epimerase [Companilactobacillus ginsenosidimutans]